MSNSGAVSPGGPEEAPLVIYVQASVPRQITAEERDLFVEAMTAEAKRELDKLVQD